MSAQHQSSFGYKPALDGLRTVAVGSVIAYHFGAEWAPGGFLGVDTFFVLSGYLITSLLLSEWGRHGTVRFGAFWARRARRLFPALLVALMAVFIWAWLAVPSDRLSSIRTDGLWTLFYSANWHFISSGQSYFDAFSEVSPLRHAWSLAIEEQFYLFWPLITFACLRLGRGRPRVLAAVCVVGMAGSAFFLAQYDAADPSRAYYGTDSRASQLLVGALLAIALLHWAPRTRKARIAVQVAGYAGAAFSVWAFATASDQDAWLYYGGFLGFAIATAAIIAAIIQPERSPLNALLSLRPVRWVGQVSYGLYLWHWPVVIAISEARTGISGIELALIRLSATFFFTTLSYYLVEQPIRRGALKGWTARLAAPAAAALVALTIILTTSGATKPPKFFRADPGEVLRTEPPSTIPSATTTSTGPGAVLPTRMLLLGDSVANSLAEALSAEAASRGITLYGAARPGCGMTTAVPIGRTATAPTEGAINCARRTAEYQSNNIAQYQPHVVLWLSSWEPANHLYDGVKLDFNTPEGDAALLADFDQSRQRLTAGGATLVMLTMPEPAANSDNGPADPELIRLYGLLNQLFRTFAADNLDTVKLVDLARIVCSTGPPCPEFVDGVRLRPRDGGHFLDGGPAWVAPRLLDAILRQFEDPSEAKVR